MILINNAMRDGIINYIYNLSSGAYSAISVYGGLQSTPNSYVGMTQLCVYSVPALQIAPITGTNVVQLRVVTSPQPSSTFLNAGIAKWALITLGSFESFEVPVTIRDSGLVLNKLAVASGDIPLIQSLKVNLGIKV